MSGVATVEDTLRVLRTVAVAATISLLAYSLVAVVLWATDRLPAGTDSGMLTLFTAGGGGLTLLMAWAVPPLIMRAATRSDPAAGYRAGVIGALCMREAAGILGLVATLLSGQIAWVLAMSAIAVVAILAAWPTRTALENVVDG